MEWNNLFLIPIILVSCLVVFLLSQRAFSYIKRLFVQRREPVAMNQVTAIMPMHDEKRTLSDIQDATESKAVLAQSEMERYLDQLADLEHEREIREQLKVVAKSRRRAGVNALKEAYHDKRQPAGPLTTAIAMNEELLNTLKRAQAERDRPASPNV